jgi:hypothetical protein
MNSTLLAIWRWLAMVGSWVFLVCRLYQFKSYLHRFFFDRQYRDTPITVYPTVKVLQEWIAKQEWVRDAIDSGWDAVCSPQKVQAVGQTGDHRIGDCFVKGTLVLRDNHELVPVESLRVGDRIWGLDKWTKVTNTWPKGVLKTWAVVLNNGSAVRLTPDHKVWVADCEKHDLWAVDSSLPSPRNGLPRGRRSRQCSCPVSERKIHRITVRELKKGQVVLQPDRIPFGSEKMDPDRAYIEGLYLADGWRETSRFSISGKDGKPKEKQKHEVKAICDRLGIATRWHKRYIVVKDSEWSDRVASMGTHAYSKRALSLNLDEGAALSLLRGIMADSGANTGGWGRTFTTTSRELFVHTRVLLKMAGLTASERYVPDHGGLGSHPVWRLQVRTNRAEREREMRAPKLLRVKAVIRDGQELPCFDFETEDHYVWLPEADWTTSQCDEFAIYLTAAIEKALALGQMQEMNIANPRFFTVMWMEKTGRPEGHNVCLLERPQPNGTTKYSYMDYGMPSEPPLDTPGQLAVLIASRYAGWSSTGHGTVESGVLCWSTAHTNLKPDQTGFGDGWNKGVNQK